MFLYGREVPGPDRKGVPMADLQFVDELPSRTGGGRHSAWEETLKPYIDHPGKWALVKSFDKASQAGSAAGHLRNDAPKPPGSWSFASRGMDLYVRYNGPEGTEPPERSGKARKARTAKA